MKSFLFKSYIAIRRFFQPDYNYIENKEKKAKRADYSDYVAQKHDMNKVKLEKPLTVENSGLAKTSSKSNSQPVALSNKETSSKNSGGSSSDQSQDKPRFRTHYDEHENDKPALSLTHEKMTMDVLSSPKELDKPMKMQVKPKINTVWTYHDEKRHQLLAHVPANGGFVNKDRDNERRAQLKAWVRPRNNKEYDRTHMLPFGYHGSENDPRLVVGWKKEHNSNELRLFENKIKSLGKAVYWHTDIRKLANGAAWRYTIYDAKTEEKIDQLTLKMDNTLFHWEK